MSTPSQRSATRLWAALAACLALLLSGCAGDTSADDGAGNETAASAAIEELEYPLTVTDMTGRSVEITAPATKAFGSGPPGTLLIYTFDPAKLAGWNTPVNDGMKAYLSDESAALPVLGRVSGGQGTFNPEVLLDEGVDVIINAGSLDPEYVQQSDDLQSQTGSPVIGLSTDPADMAEVYDILGKVFGDPERATALLAHAGGIYDKATSVAASIPEDKRVTVYYGQGDQGLSTAGSGSIHSQIIDIIGAKNVAGEAPQTSGRVDIDAEQLLAWDPDWIILIPGSGTADQPTVAANQAFSSLQAVADGHVLLSPSSPFGWFDAPPAINQILGVVWAAEAIYPDEYDFDVEQEIIDFYADFYHTDLTQQQVTEMLTASGFPS